MSRPTEPSLPPSEPRPPQSSKPGRISTVDPMERPARVQLIAALGLGVVLVAVPLYLWRRPRSVDTVTTTADGGADTSIVTDAAIAANAGANTATPSAGNAPAASASNGGITMTMLPPPDGGSASDNPDVSPITVVACHDRGSKRTAPAACDHVAAVEQAFTQAIRDVGVCVTGGGSLEYLADVSFARKKDGIHVTTPRKDRKVKSAREATSCAAKVKAKLVQTSLDGVAHAHDRYVLAITATYR